jgi:hypothetical protein
MQLQKNLQEATGSDTPGESNVTGQGARGRMARERDGAQWVPPERDVLKVNVDGAFNPVTKEAAIGVIVRDHAGQPHIMAWRVVSRCRDAEESEALALLKGAELAEQWAANIRTDCANLIQKLECNGRDNSVISRKPLSLEFASEDLEGTK